MNPPVRTVLPALYGVALLLSALFWRGGFMSVLFVGAALVALASIVLRPGVPTGEPTKRRKETRGR